MLAILPRFPYPVDKGDKLRAFHHLRYLSRFHEISLFALNDGPVPEEHLQVLRGFCKHITVYPLGKPGIFLRLLANIAGNIPFQTAWHFDAGAEKKLRDCISAAAPDVLFYQLVRTAEFAKDTHLPKVLDLQDPMSENIRLRMAREPWWKRWIFRREYRRLLAYEARMPARFDEICIISERDKADLPEPARHTARLVSNGIDGAFYTPQPAGKTSDIVFVGSMSYLPNIEAAVFLVKEVLPELQKRGVEVHITIVGADPSAEVRALAGPSVTVTGRVPDTRTYYASARMMLAPMFINTGIQNKILEAAAMGLPVVTTAQANEAVGAEPGRQLLLARTPVEFAEQAIRLLGDTAFAESVAGAGQEFVRSRFTWEACGRQLEEVLEAAVAKKKK